MFKLGEFVTSLSCSGFLTRQLFDADLFDRRRDLFHQRDVVRIIVNKPPARSDTSLF